MNKPIASLVALAVLFSPIVGFFKVNAAGLTGMSISGTGITSGSSAVSAAITPTIAFTITNAIAPTDTIQITFAGNGSNNGITVTDAAGLASADITVGGTCSGTVTLAGSPIAQNTDNPTLSLTGITGTAGSCTVIIAASNIETDSAAGNLSIGITTSSGDFGSFLYYIGDANDVSVTAIVPPTLSFVLRDSADSADLSPGATSGNRVCNLGILQLATTPNPATSVNACQYRLRIATNATSGYAASYISTSSDTTGGGFERLAKNATVNIPNVAGGGDDLTATNGYGARLTEVSGNTRGATFTGTATNYFVITADTTTTMVSSSGPIAPNSAPDTTNTTLVAHGARISAAQEVGNYSHVITYTVTATF